MKRCEQGLGRKLFVNLILIMIRRILRDPSAIEIAEKYCFGEIVKRGDFKK